MALYEYQAFLKSGKKATGTIEANSSQAAREQLLGKGLYPISIKTFKAAQKPVSFLTGFFMRARVPDMRDTIFFTKQLALLLQSGVPLLQALELLVEQSEGPLRAVVSEVKDDVQEGKSVASSLEKFPKVFDRTYVQLVRAGEASGKLEHILNELTIYLEHQEAIKRRVKKALSYPLFQLAFIVIIVALLLAFVVPQIAETLTGEGAELPWPTRFLMALSNIVTQHYIILCLVILGVYGVFKWWKNTPRGAYLMDALKLKLPLVRYFSRMGTVVQFSRTLGMLIEGGVNLAESLFIVSTIVDNRILAKTLSEARESIIKQGHIAEYLKKTNLFPPVAIYLINTGEQSGKLGTMLLTVAQYYETEVTDLAESLANKLGPIMTVIMALIVGFIILAILWPIMQAGLSAEGMF